VALTVTPLHALPSSDTDFSAVERARADHAHPDHARLGPSTIGVSATLAANETMDTRRRSGEPVLPMAFGEAGLPAHPMLRGALARAAGYTSYGPVAGHLALREAAAFYWSRRGLPTEAANVVCGPGSKALLFGLMTAIGGDVVVTRPSWVSYAAQASLAGRVAHFARGSAGERPPGPLGHRHAARQPDRDAGLARGRSRPVRGRGGLRPDHYLGRDLPRSDSRP
jgi:aspartate aminotransferase